jgi:hypothetical protein
MANLLRNLLRINSAHIVDEVYANFSRLAEDLKRLKGMDISVHQSYKSEHEIVDELRQRHKDKQKLYPDLTINQLVSSGKYEEVRTVIDYSTNTDFYPPLSNPYDYFEANTRRLGSISPTSQVIYPVPSLPKQDPRRTGRLVIPSPTNLFKYPDIYQWLLNNSFNYGFVIYLDVGLLWEGRESLQRRFRSDESKEQILGRFLKHADVLDFNYNNIAFDFRRVVTYSSVVEDQTVGLTGGIPQDDPIALGSGPSSEQNTLTSIS